MLVLTRRIGERLRIGSDIELVVLEVRGGDVRLGVTAPASVAIHREEIYLKIHNASATRVQEAAAREPRSRKTSAPTAEEGSRCAPFSDD